MSLTLPPIDLETLKPRTRDWLLARAATEETTPQEILRNTLDRRAAAEGYREPAASPTTGDIIRGAVGAR